MPDRVLPIPIDRGLAHLVEDTHASNGGLSHLNDGAGIAFVEEVDERAAGAVDRAEVTPLVLVRNSRDYAVAMDLLVTAIDWR